VLDDLADKLEEAEGRVGDVGFSGAAATSFGLAFLGGGSIASGGFGMVGGSAVLGVAFGGGRAAQMTLSAPEIDVLELTVGERNLAILLATGRILTELGYAHLPAWIRGRILERRMAARRGVDALAGGDQATKERIQRVQARHDLYERGLKMANGYSWTSSIDLLRRGRRW
jgi:hypothetical protein